MHANVYAFMSSWIPSQEERSIVLQIKPTAKKGRNWYITNIVEVIYFLIFQEVAIGHLQIMHRSIIWESIPLPHKWCIEMDSNSHSFYRNEIIVIEIFMSKYSPIRWEALRGFLHYPSGSLLDLCNSDHRCTLLYTRDMRPFLLAFEWSLLLTQKTPLNQKKIIVAKGYGFTHSIIKNLGTTHKHYLLDT